MTGKVQATTSQWKSLAAQLEIASSSSPDTILEELFKAISHGFVAIVNLIALHFSSMHYRSHFTPLIIPLMLIQVPKLDFNSTDLVHSSEIFEERFGRKKGQPSQLFEDPILSQQGLRFRFLQTQPQFWRK